MAHKFAIVRVKTLHWIILIGIAVGIYSLTLPNYYRSISTLLPVEAKIPAGNLAGLTAAASTLGVSLPGGDGSDSNFIDILNSRWMKMELLGTEFQYSSKKWYFASAKTEKKTLYEYLKAKNSDKACQSMSEVFSVTRDIKSRVITVSAETTSADLSQQIVTRAVILLERFIQEKTRTRGGMKAAFAQARLSEIKAELSEIELKYSKFLNNNKNYPTSSSPEVRLSGATLESEYRLRQQLMNAVAISREQSLMEEKNDLPILNVLDSGNHPLEKSRPSRLMFVFSSIMLTFFIGTAWENRDWLRIRFFS